MWPNNGWKTESRLSTASQLRIKIWKGKTITFPLHCPLIPNTWRSWSRLFPPLSPSLSSNRGVSEAAIFRHLKREVWLGFKRAIHHQSTPGTQYCFKGLWLCSLLTGFDQVKWWFLLGSCWQGQLALKPTVQTHTHLSTKTIQEMQMEETYDRHTDSCLLKTNETTHAYL